MGYAAIGVYDYFDNKLMKGAFPRFVLMREDERPGHMVDGEAVVSAGTRTTAQNKPKMIEALKKLLRNGTMAMYRRFVVGNPDCQPDGAKPPRESLVNELKTYVCEIQYKARGINADYQRPVIRYRGFRGNDRTDFVMCLAIVTLQSRLFLTTDKYMRWRGGR
jgi:hypothetical protein